MQTCYPITRPIRTTAPTLTQEPVTLAEARKQCEIGDSISDHDPHLSLLIRTAREQVENDTGIVCYTGEHTFKMTDWGDGELIELRSIRPVTAIGSITYVDGSGIVTTWGSSNYQLETSTVVPVIRLAYASTWPALRGDINGITITLTAGYATVLAIPGMVKLACLLLINHWFENRGIVSLGTISPEISMTYNALINRLSRSTYP